ncbi:MAG: PAS domain-containing sensor histidine kinase [Cyclobacteriaceae bacterium]
MAEAIKVEAPADVSSILLSEGKIVDCDTNWIKLVQAQDQVRGIGIALSSCIQSYEEDGQGNIREGRYTLTTLKGEKVPVKIIRQTGSLISSGAILINISRCNPCEEVTTSAKSVFSSNLSILNSSPDIIFSFDRDHRHIFINERVRELLGLDPVEMINKSHRELGFDPEECRFFESCIDSAYASGHEERFQFALWGKYFDLYVIPIKNQNDDIVEVATFAREISELTSIKKALSASQQHLKLALDITKLAWWQINTGERTVYLNPQFRTILSLPDDVYPENKLPIEEYLEKFVPDSQQHILNEAFHSAARATDPEYSQVFEYTLRQHTGQEIRVRSISRVQIGPKGNVEIIYGTIQDITELWRARKVIENYRNNLENSVLQKTYQLTRSEAKLNDALNLANLGTWEFNFETRKFSIGERVLEIIGFNEDTSEDTIELQDFLKIIHPDDLERYFEIGKRTLKAKDESFSETMLFRIVRKSGEIRKLFISIKIVLNKTGWHIRHYGTIQDITDIYNAEKTLNRLSNIIEATPDIVFVFRRDGKILYSNKAGKSFWNLEDEAEVRLRHLFSIEQIDLFYQHVDELDKLGYYKDEGTIVNEHGIQVPVSMIIIVHPGDKGEPNNYSITITDISEVKKAQQELVFKNNELDTFLYRASHDLRGPVASMAGLNQLAEMEVVDPKASRFFNMFREQIDRLNEIIATLAELTIIKEKELVQEEINVEELIYEVVASLYKEPASDTADWTIEVNFEHPVVADRSLLLVILHGLLENSLRYARPDTDPRIRVQANLLDKHRLTIFVDDNGVGIEKSIQGKVFNMFFRGNERSSGSGLGLYVLRNAVDRLDGTVILSSEANVGTTFRVELMVNKE